MAKKKLGLIVTLGAIVGSAAWVYKKYDSIKSMYHKVSLFKGERIDFDTFEGEAVAGMFSGLLVDLSSAEFSEKEVYLDVYGFCSGIRVLIPKDVEVVLEGTNKASGVHLDQDEDILKTRTLFINYNLTASGLSISDNIDDSHDDSIDECDKDETCCDDDCCTDEACCDDDCCKDETCCDDDCCTDEACSDDDCCTDEASSDNAESKDMSVMKEEAILEEEDSLEEDINNEEETTLEDEPKWENNFEALNTSAQELDAAAADVEEAIDQFVDKDALPFDSVVKDTDDDFFE